ncbi:small GTP-binding protein [Tritrichomonas foetus]|uniref:Small GTP-binding protein n=1 Tax=Tritrichomonas foetus TaxID=1144522 RepID=A0A1J4JG74_9EUKA|nr:small GTP-binding protein [Tritrichomonas foetus]|eukprot:OHS96204.1 small GTP-binding protein [Tritrichomonas foetus]
MQKKVDFSVKTVIIGDSGVGKTCVLTRFTRDFFDETSQPTLGVEFLAKIVETPQNRIELQLWDTAGQELFRSVTRGYYRGSVIAYLVFDITSHISFDNLEKWIADIKEVALPNVITVLIGNKSDLADSRQVTQAEIEAFAKDHKMDYFEVSAKTGDRVVEAITSCLSIIDERAASGVFAVPQTNESIIYDKDSNQKSSCC